MRNWRHRSLSFGLFVGLFVAMGAALPACEGAGEGTLDGTLFLRGCPPQDPTTAGSDDVPNPLPAFSLLPQYFFGDVQYSVMQGFSTPDPRGVNRLLIRLQRNGGQPDHADVFELLIYDLDNYMSRQDAAIAAGQPGMPIVPPAIDGDTAPLPPDPAASVRGSLSLNITCWYPIVEPMLTGYVKFTSLSSQLGDQVAGDVSVTVSDARAIREQGDPPPAPDAAGQLSGSFSFPLRAGPLVP